MRGNVWTGRGLLAAALRTKELSAGEGCFELSVGNPDKGLMSLEEAKRRVAQFVKTGLPLVVTQVPCSILSPSSCSCTRKNRAGIGILIGTGCAAGILQT